MSAVEEIQAAIDKLTAIRDLPPVVVDFRATGDDSMDAWFERAEMKLAMFHRTIDAQIAVLDSAQISIGQVGTPSKHALALARAINGATS